MRWFWCHKQSESVTESTLRESFQFSICLFVMNSFASLPLSTKHNLSRRERKGGKKEEENIGSPEKGGERKRKSFSAMNV